MNWSGIAKPISFGASAATIRGSCAMLLASEDRREASAIVALRRIWPGELHLVERHLSRLSPHDRRMRFGRPVGEDFLHSHVGRLRTADCIVKAAYVAGVCRGIGEIHFLENAAEAALSVEHPWQGRGIGDLLLKSLLLAAGNRGYRRIVIFCLNENHRMIALARRNHATFSITADGAVGEFHRKGGSVLSWQKELLDEGLGHLLVFPILGPREPGG
jgi:GNAT superfamily N-acetyltransferase